MHIHSSEEKGPLMRMMFSIFESWTSRGIESSFRTEMIRYSEMSKLLIAIPVVSPVTTCRNQFNRVMKERVASNT